jgi:hypothetical protein
MRPIFFALGSVLLLSACTDGDWENLASFDQGAPQDVAEAASPVQAVAAAPAAPSADPSFCRDVAKQDATANDFDPATQQRMAQQSYAQCVAIYSK